MSAFAPRARKRGLVGYGARRLAMWLPAVGIAACARSHTSGALRPESTPCVLVEALHALPESITVAVSVSNLERGANTQSYSALPAVECRGQLYRQLARISPTDVIAHGRHWTITLPAPASDTSLSPRVNLRSIDASAARDALDAGVDLLITDDPAIASYAAQRNELQTLPLPWDRTYVVLTATSPVPNADANFNLTLAELVADAVRADSRIAERSLWWETRDNCPAAATTSAPARASSRVVYRSGDRVAQGLAERLVALAGSRSAPGASIMDSLLPGLTRVGLQVTATALLPSEFAEAVRAGDALAYVVPLRRFAVSPCHEREVLLRAAPWLQSVIPLIDTRSSVIVRRGRVGLSVDADGSLRLLDAASAKNSKP